MSLFRPEETPEELHKRIDALLEERTQAYPECIVCRNPVVDSSQLSKSIHGPYHVWCVDGHL